jgi:hypothetical protein
MQRDLGTFVNCDFEFECPKEWLNLTETSSKLVKFCDSCNKNVYMCLDQKEFEDKKSQGVCIALFYWPEELKEQNNPYPEVKLSLGLPRP